MQILQKTGRKTKAFIIMIMFLISTLSFSLFFYTEPAKAVTGPPDDINVMLTTDWQNAGSPHVDMNANCDIDLLFHDGDQVNDPSVQAEWDTFHSNWDAVTGTGTILYRNYTHGNHESLFWYHACSGVSDEDLQWHNRSRLCPAYDPSYGNFETWLNTTRLGPNWTYVYGNVIFIGLPLAYRNCYPVVNPSNEDVYAIDTPWLNWFNQTVQANTDKNIIVLCHLSIHTGTRDYYYGLWEQDELMWILNNYDIVAWVYGHNHAQPAVALVNGTYHVHAGKGAGGSDDSVMFNFTNGSSNIDISVRHHTDGGSWEETISGYDTIPLDYAFDSMYGSEEDDAEIEFVSIDGDTNGTTIYDSTPVFNWTVVADTIQYWLQVATDSGFSSLVVNLTDINEVNYPTKYNANATRVSFTLPDADGLPSYDVYYCRVRAKRL